MLTWSLSLGVLGGLNFRANGMVSGVNVTVPASSSLSISSFGGLTSNQAGFESSNIVMASPTALLGSVSIDISNVTLSNTAVTVASSILQNGYTFPWTISDVNVSVSPFQTRFALNSSPFTVTGVSSGTTPFSLLRSTVTLPSDRNYTLFRSSSIASMNITSSTIQAPRLFGGALNGSSGALQSLTLLHSSVSHFVELISTTSSPLSLTPPPLASPPNVPPSSPATTTPATTTPFSLLPLPLLSPSSTLTYPINFFNATVSGMTESQAQEAGLTLTSLPRFSSDGSCTPGTINASTITYAQLNRHAGPCDMRFEQASLVDVDGLYRGYLSFTNTTFMRSDQNYSLSSVMTDFSGFEATLVGEDGLRLVNAHPTLFPWNFSPAQSYTPSGTSFIGDGKITVDHMMLQPGTILKFASLNLPDGAVITGSPASTIMGVDFASHTRKREEATQNAWTFGQGVTIQGTTLDLSNTQTIRFIPSLPPSTNTPILLTSDGGAIVSSNGNFMTGMSVEWPDNATTPSPVESLEWPLFVMTNFSDPLQGGLFSLALLEDDIFPFYGRANVSSSDASLSTVYFHFGDPIAPHNCSGRLPSIFYCLRGLWKANKGYTNTSFVLPAGEVTVRGNVTIQTSIIVPNTASSLTVSGCLQTSEISLNTKSRINITQSSSCSHDSLTAASNSALIRSTPAKSCEKYNVGKEQSRTSLVLFVSIDNSGCSSKWIIVGAVIGGVAVIAIIVGAVLFVCTRKTANNTRAAARISTQ